LADTLGKKKVTRVFTVETAITVCNAPNHYSLFISNEPLSNDVMQHKNVLQFAPTTTSTEDELEDLQIQSELSVKASFLPDVAPTTATSTTDAADNNKAIDAVTLLFDILTDNQSLAEPMRMLIQQLQMPILKICLADKTFYGQKDHPARRLLSSVTQAGMNWKIEDGFSENTLYGKISLAVQHITNHSSATTDTFKQTLTSFKLAIQDTDNKIEQLKKQAEKITSRKEQLESAKNNAKFEIESRLDQYLIPESIKNMLKNGWYDVLMMANFVQEDDADAWKKAINVMDELIWSLQPKESDKERQALLERTPQLMHDIRQGLADVSYDTDNTEIALRDLKNHHVKVIRGNISVPTLSATQIITKGCTPSEPTQQTTELTQEEQQLEDAKNLEIGTWIEFVDGQGDTASCKLSWKSRGNDKFLFVNRKGQKIAEMTLNGLAILLKRESTHKIENPSLVKSVLAVLKEHH
jgi:hypothetical protein